MKSSRTVRARVLAGVIALMGLLNVLSSAFIPAVTGRLHFLRQVLPPVITLGSRSLTLVAGFFLMAVAWNLAQRKRAAWALTVWLLAISAFSHVLKGLDAEAALIALALLGILWWFRRDFSVRSDPGVVQSLLFAAPYTVIFFFLYGIAGFYILRHELGAPFDLSAAISEIINLATLQDMEFYRPLTRHAHWFTESIPLMAGVGAFYLFYSLMRPVLRPAPLTRRDRDVAAEIIHAHGQSSLAYFALGHDKSYFFNGEGTCVVPYVLVRDVALAAGDPIGPPEDVGPTIDAFVAHCEENDWLPAFYQVQEATLPLYRDLGLEALKIGEEALLEIQPFDLRGKIKEDLRTAVNRARREGWQFLFFDRAIEDPTTIAQLQAISEAWLADKFGGEMGFTMGASPIAGSAETLVSAVADAAGQVKAFVTWTPMFATNGWTADFMRRAPDAENGMMEYLVVSTIEALRQRGAMLLSLGLAPLANTSPATSEAVLSLEKGLELVYERFNTAYRFKSLQQFKAKFAPRWESRYLVYPGLAALPRVAFALLNAQMPNFSLTELARLVRPARQG